MVSYARRVLVIDDNRDSADSLMMILQIAGHQVRCAYDGINALATAEEFHPQAALLDLSLPGMHGYEVASHLRAHHPGITLIALSGYSQFEDIQRSKAAGFAAHLVKPVDPQTIFEILKEVPL